MNKVEVTLVSAIGIELIKTDVYVDLLKRYVTGLCSQFHENDFAVFIKYKNKKYRFDKIRQPEEYKDEFDSEFILDWELIKRIEGSYYKKYY